MSRLIWLSSGLGYGHAARDLRIIERIRALRPDVTVEIAAHGTAVEYYRTRGAACADLGIPDDEADGPLAPWRVLHHLHRAQRPDLVVTDEVMSALPACRHMLEVGCVLLTDWFYADLGAPERDVLLNSAQEVLVLDFAEAHRVPADVVVPVRFTGPLIAPLTGDGAAARTRIGAGPDERVFVLALGGRPHRPEARHMLARTLLAWWARAEPGDHLVVLGDPGPLAGDPRIRRAGLHWLGLVRDPAQWFLAADAVIADAMGFTTCDLAANGVPVVALVDPAVSRAFPASFARRVEYLSASGLIIASDSSDSPEQLWQHLRSAAGGRGEKAGGRGEKAGGAAEIRWGTADDAARRILDRLDHADRPELPEPEAVGAR